MRFRTFNDQGVKAFAAFLDGLRLNPAAAIPVDLLQKPNLTQELDPPIDAIPQPFATRMDFAKWLHNAAQQARTDIPRRDPGFWAWLTLALFEQVCPADGLGRRKPKEDARYLPMIDMSRRYYRHCLLGPYSIYLLYQKDPTKASALLCGSLAKLTDEAYRLFVENQLVVFPAAVGVLTQFYFDASKNVLKRGSQTKKPGSIRRLVRLLTQYGRTFDLDVVPTAALSEMLPYEFERWRRTGQHLFHPT